jgi:hypothetical protein
MFADRTSRSSVESAGSMSMLEPDPIADGVGKGEVEPLDATDEQLFSGMDRAAVSFLKSLEGVEMITGADGNPEPRYSLQERMKAFDLVGSWLARRHKLRPVENVEAPGIEMMRQVIQEQPIEKNVVMVPPKKAGRPTKEATRQRKVSEEAAKRFKAMVGPDDEHDDSALKNLLRGVAS